jgi:hypothetical protein
MPLKDTAFLSWKTWLEMPACVDVSTCSDRCTLASELLDAGVAPKSSFKHFSGRGKGNGKPTAKTKEGTGKADVKRKEGKKRAAVYSDAAERCI